MPKQGRRKAHKKLSAETKGEVFLQVTGGEISQADATRKWQLDVSTVIGIRRKVEDAALAALSRSPNRPLKERNCELEAAQAEIGALTEAVKAQAIEIAVIGETPAGLSGPLPAAETSTAPPTPRALVRASVSELASGPVDRAPLLGDEQDGVDLRRQDAVHREPVPSLGQHRPSPR